MAPAPKNSDSALALQAAIDGDLYLLKGTPPLSWIAASPIWFGSGAKLRFGAIFLRFVH